MSWLKRHRWGLIALAVLVPASLLAAMSIVWFRYMESQVQNPVVVAKGDSGTYEAQKSSDDGLVVAGTAELTLTDYSVFPWDTRIGREVGLLEGTEAVSALIHVDATGLGEDTYSCDAVLIAPGPEGDRVWEVATSEIDYYPSDPLEAYCSLNLGTEFDWEAVFVVPEGVGDEARLVITRGSFEQEHRLQLER